MPARESEAIVLRSFPLGEGDRLVSFLSRAYGRMRGVASGARRPKSRFGSTLEPLSYIRIWFYERETRDLVRINQSELIESFLDVQGSYEASLALAVASEISESVLGEREVADANFRLLLLTAQTVKAGANPNVALAYFGLWTVRLGGWLPRLDICCRCGAELNERAYVSEEKALVCPNCRISGQLVISKEALDLARRILESNLRQLLNVSINDMAANDVREFILDAVETHLEKRLHSRNLLRENMEPYI